MPLAQADPEIQALVDREVSPRLATPRLAAARVKSWATCGGQLRARARRLHLAGGPSAFNTPRRRRSAGWAVIDRGRGRLAFELNRGIEHRPPRPAPRGRAPVGAAPVANAAGCG